MGVQRMSGRADGVLHCCKAAFASGLALIASTIGSALALAESPEDGRAIYERRCSVCHGDKGDGASWASGSLNPPPRDFTRTNSDALSRGTMIDAVAHGRKGTAMTAWESRLSSAQIAAVVDFVRGEFMSRKGGIETRRTSGVSFPGGFKGDMTRGGAFFHANCAECHGHAGDGRGRRADFMVRKPLDFTAPNTKRNFDRGRLFQSISRGVPGSTMPAWSKVLNDQQIADVAEYVYGVFIGDESAVNAGASANAEAPGAGGRIYLRYCSYCHGYKGDGNTAAAQVLDPKPRDFTSVSYQSVDSVVAAVREGRTGTAMPSFVKVLSGEDITSVAEYVTQSLAERKGEDGRYHTLENGWPDHEVRYGPAIPFALGEVAVDAPPSALSPAHREGLALFKGACVSCHFGKREASVTTRIAYSSPNSNEYEAGPHDKVPEIANLTETEMEGRRLYQAACAQCHAADGTAQNWIGRFLDPSPTDFNAQNFRAILSSGLFVDRTLRPPDGTSMPSFENVLSREQVEAIAAYARRAFLVP